MDTKFNRTMGQPCRLREFQNLTASGFELVGMNRCRNDLTKLSNGLWYSPEIHDIYRRLDHYCSVRPEELLHKVMLLAQHYQFINVCKTTIHSNITGAIQKRFAKMVLENQVQSFEEEHHSIHQFGYMDIRNPTVALRAIEAVTATDQNTMILRILRTHGLQGLVSALHTVYGKIITPN